MTRTPHQSTTAQHTTAGSGDAVRAGAGPTRSRDPTRQQMEAHLGRPHPESGISFQDLQEAVELHALANTTLETVDPPNPTAGEEVFVEVKAIMTQIDPCFGQCTSFTGWEADLKVGGQVIDSGTGFTMCEGDEAAFLSGTVTLPAGDHSVVVDGQIDDIDPISCAVEGTDDVRDSAGTITVESAFDPTAVTAGGCPAPEPSQAPTDAEVSVQATVENPNSQQSTTDVVWSWGDVDVARRSGVSVAPNSTTTVGQTFIAQDAGISLSEAQTRRVEARTENSVEASRPARVGSRGR